MENAVQAFMSRTIATIDVSDSTHTAAKIMRERKISSLIAVERDNEGNKPVGIVTERDLVYRVCAEGANSKERKVKDIMSSPVATIDPQSSLEGAADLMLSNKVRHLLVVDATGKMLGVVAPTDLNKYLRGQLDMDDVKGRILQAVLDETEMTGS